MKDMSYRWSVDKGKVKHEGRTSDVILSTHVIIGGNFGTLAMVRTL